jgi:hypothetical protein
VRISNAGYAFVPIVALWLTSAGCRRPPINVGVVFENAWRLGSETLNESDQLIVKRAAIDTLRRAYLGFDVHFVEGTSADRLIRIEDTPFASDKHAFMALGAVGATYPLATASSVRFDALFYAELVAAHCADAMHCSKSRKELLEGLGRGIGATGAHELGHQAGFRFAIHSRCDDCFDSSTATSAEHFFGQKHWSDGAVEIMRRILPPLPEVRSP